MALNIQNPKVHDHTDPHIVVINESKLTHHLYHIQKFLKATNNGLGWFSTFISLGLAAYLTEKFKNIGPINGDTIRAVFIIGSIFALILTVRSIWYWFLYKNKYEPEIFTKNLLTQNPLTLSQVIPILSKLKNKKFEE